LLWASSQTADLRYLDGHADAQADNILSKLQTTLTNGGTDLSQALRIRALVTRPHDVAAVNQAIRNAFPKDPPAVSIVIVPTPLPVTEAAVAMDAVAFVGS
jgi:enamine deaminase RidA (YjgF/YER057c/UK114 family)